MAISSAEILNLYKILLQDLSTLEIQNSLVFTPNHLSNSDVPLVASKLLGTKTQTIIGAINELLQEISSVEIGLKRNQQLHFQFLGDYLADPAVKEDILKIDTSVSKAVIKLAKELYGSDLDNPVPLVDTVRTALGLPAPTITDALKYIRVNTVGNAYEYSAVSGGSFSGTPDKIIISNSAGDDIESSTLGLADIVKTTDLALQSSKILYVDINHTGTLVEDGSQQRPYKNFTQFDPTALDSNVLIKVASGTYTTNITLSNNVSIIGSGVNNTIFTGTLTTGSSYLVLNDFTLSNTLTINGDVTSFNVSVIGNAIIDGSFKGVNFSTVASSGTALTISTGDLSFYNSFLSVAMDVPTIIQNSGTVRFDNSKITGNRITGPVVSSIGGFISFNASRITNVGGGASLSVTSTNTSPSTPNTILGLFHVGNVELGGSYAYVGEIFGTGTLTGSLINRRDSDSIENGSTVTGVTITDALNTLNSSSSLSFDLPLSETGGTVSITQADTTTEGSLSSMDWNTFNSKQDTLTFSTPLIDTAGVITINPATTTQDGYLTSTDWNVFDSKLAVADIINDLVTGGVAKALSAEQGKILQTNKLEKLVPATADSIALLTDTGILGDSGVSISDFALVDHDHSGVYEPVDSTILRESDVVDHLLSISIIAPLSANQGRELSESINTLNNGKIDILDPFVQGNLVEADASGSLVDSGNKVSDFMLSSSLGLRGSKVLYVDGSRTGTYVPDGSQSSPYKVIQDAIDASPTYSTLLIHAGVYTEDLSLTKDGLSLVGFGSGKHGVNISIEGKATIAGCTKVSFRNLNFENLDSGGTDYVLAINSTGTSNIIFESCSIIKGLETATTVLLDGAVSGSIYFRDCYIKGEVNNSISTTSHSGVHFNGINNKEFHVINNTNQAVTSVRNCGVIGMITHLGGELRLDSVGQIIANASGISVSSSANSGHIVLNNVSLLQDDQSYGDLLKVGSCAYSFIAVDHSVDQTSFSGALVTRGRLSNDITANLDGVNYTGLKSEDVKTHLSKIDTVLGTIPPNSSASFHDVTLTGTTIVDLVTSPSNANLSLVASAGNNTIIGNNLGQGLTILDSGLSTFSKDLVVNGDFTVNGTTTTIDTQNLQVEDTIITLNRNATVPALSGIEIKKGLGAEEKENLLWDSAVGWHISTGDEDIATKYKIWHENNIGASSGLDADLLDGQEGAYYLEMDNFTGTLATVNGGTNNTTFTANNLVIANGDATGLVSSTVSVTDLSLTGHTHPSDDITYTKTGWTSISDVNDALDDLKDNKADLTHEHVIDDITSFPTLQANKLVFVNSNADGFVYKDLREAQVIIKITAANVVDGYFIIPSIPLEPSSVRISYLSGTMQTNKSGDLFSVISTYEFEPDSINKTRIYFNNIDGHTNLANNFIEDEIYLVRYLYLV